MMKNANKPAFPIYHESNDGHAFITENGLTKYEKTCIELGVPETGDPNLDEIIRKAERRDLAKAAMQGFLADGAGDSLHKEEVSKIAVSQADAFLTELEE